MKNVFLFASVMVGLALICGCGPRESESRIRSLTEDDCRSIQEKVAKLCAAYVPIENHEVGGPGSWLSGDSIPAALADLKPSRILVGANYAIIELWHTPAGDDTIYVEQHAEGIWQIRVHEGNWMNKDRLIWSSNKMPNQTPEPTAPSGRGSS